MDPFRQVVPLFLGNPKDFDRFMGFPKFNLQAEVEKPWTEKVAEWSSSTLQVVRRHHCAAGAFHSENGWPNY